MIRIVVLTLLCPLFFRKHSIILWSNKNASDTIIPLDILFWMTDLINHLFKLGKNNSSDGAVGLVFVNTDQDGRQAQATNVHNLWLYLILITHVSLLSVCQMSLS